MNPSRTRPALAERQLRLAWQSSPCSSATPTRSSSRASRSCSEAADQLPRPVAGPLGTFLAYLGFDPAARGGRGVRRHVRPPQAVLPLPDLVTCTATPATAASPCCGSRAPTGPPAWSLDDDELPDHLAVLLEFGATADPAAAWDLLLQHRAGVELLRLALADSRLAVVVRGPGRLRHPAAAGRRRPRGRGGARRPGAAGRGGRPGAVRAAGVHARAATARVPAPAHLRALRERTRP